MSDRNSQTRRRFLAATGTAFAGSALAGCSALPGGNGGEQGKEQITLSDFRGSGPLVEQRPEPQGTSIEDLPALEGELTIYLGGGEGGLYVALLDLLKKMYPKFEPKPRINSSATLANTIIQEQKGGNSPADVFWAVDAGSLGTVAEAGYATTLPEQVVKPVPKNFHPDDQWVGVAGRARSVPFNTNKLSRSDIPDKVLDFPGAPTLQGNMGWAPTYGAFQSFVTAMRVLNGEQKTKEWLNGMQKQNITEYPDEFLVSNAVADGEIAAGFANHYYAVRVKSARPEAPIELAFTKDDAGALVNASGAEIIKGTQNEELAQNFIRHLLSAEAQEFFATRTFAYPMIPGVQPVGGLPTIDELNPPELSLSKLSDIQPTIELMKETGVLA
ncbi:extracellular solute-binding protein [Halospeciosus flavus]|uniref:Extracellular solute-binding protein n=1 Tax=Halospeciosus flavus TaxID=3032283 RepID=A0ABD5Z2P9_9EURY|nr:extracellular solute-binding protein [Halospeciosus flavus]